MINLPLSLQNLSFTKYILEKTDWDQSLLNNSNYIISDAKQKPQCYWIKSQADVELHSLIGYPQINQIYSPPEYECQYNNVGIDKYSSESGSKTLWIIFVITFLVVCILVTISIGKCHFGYGFRFRHVSLQSIN